MTAAQQESAGRASAVRYADPLMQTVMGLYLAEMRRVVKLAQEESAKLEGALIRGREAGQRLACATWAEERAYLQAAITFGQLAREQLIHAYLPVPIALAKRFRCDDVEFLDAVQEGNLALIDAIDCYQPAPDDSLFAHICRRIRAALWRQIHDKDLIRQPGHIARCRRRISASLPLLKERLGRQPNVAEIAAEIGMTEQTVRLTLAMAYPICSLSQPLESTDGLLAGDAVAADDGIDMMTISEALLVSVWAALERLTPLQRQVITLSLGLEDQEPRSFQTVSACLGYRNERTSWNLYHVAIDQLRRQLLSPADYAALTSISSAVAARTNMAVLSRPRGKQSKATLIIRKNHYEALGRPDRVRVLICGDGLQIVPDPRGCYQVVERGEYIRVPIDSIARRQQMQVGRYEAQVVDGGLHIGAYLGRRRVRR